MNSLFNLIFYQPIYNLLLFLYKYLPGHDLGITIVVLTLIIRFILHPLSNYSLKNQKILTKLQPKILEIQKKYKDNKEEQTKATMELYQKEKINPFSGCLPLLLQLPILIALYQVFLKGLDPKIFNLISLGIINLSKPNIFLALAKGFLQFFQTKISMALPKETAKQTD
ncbi:membrane protein insertase YidC, partial [bacterium]|nr:membrane protein insertase YidC [bacterium]